LQEAGIRNCAHSAVGVWCGRHDRGAFGLYSVVSYSVSHRLREFAIRIAVGAGRTDVVRLAALSPLVSSLAGLGIGISGSLALNCALAPWSIGNLSDPIVLAGISAVLLAMTIAAALIPVRHAASVEPAKALRGD
jgi:ABC-type antimicrobial peptide transport system permease subunit